MASAEGAVSFNMKPPTLNKGVFMVNPFRNNYQRRRGYELNSHGQRRVNDGRKKGDNSLVGRGMSENTGDDFYSDLGNYDESTRNRGSSFRNRYDNYAWANLEKRRRQTSPAQRYQRHDFDDDDLRHNKSIYSDHEYSSRHQKYQLDDYDNRRRNTSERQSAPQRHTQRHTQGHTQGHKRHRTRDFDWQGGDYDYQEGYRGFEEDFDDRYR